MTLFQINERIGNFLLAAMAVPFGLVGIGMAIHVLALLT